jgi:hypothetical protein
MEDVGNERGGSGEEGSFLKNGGSHLKLRGSLCNLGG